MYNVSSFQLLQVHLRDLNSNLENLDELQDDLKECVSPSDVRAINQQAWMVKQHHSELENKVDVRIQELEQQIEMLSLFRNRFDRFMNWADNLELRLRQTQVGWIMNASRILF